MGEEAQNSNENWSDHYHPPEWNAKKEKYILKKKSGDGPDQLEFSSYEEITNYFGQSSDITSTEISEIVDDDSVKENVDDNEELENVGQGNVLDQNKELEKCKNRAQKVLKSLFDIYLGENAIEKSEYLQIRKELDEMTLESLMFQLVTNKHALQKMLDQIDSGNVHPRLFEVFSQIQKTNLEILKSQTLHLMSVEENVKKMKDEISGIIPQEAEEVPSEDEDDLMKKGTRNYMKNLIQGKNNKDSNE